MDFTKPGKINSRMFYIEREITRLWLRLALATWLLSKAESNSKKHNLCRNKSLTEKIKLGRNYKFEYFHSKV